MGEAITMRLGWRSGKTVALFQILQDQLDAGGEPKIAAPTEKAAMQLIKQFVAWQRSCGRKPSIGAVHFRGVEANE